MFYALITGASKGIGRSIAFELAKRNYNVLLTARSAELLQQNVYDIKKQYPVKADCFVLDLSEINAPKKLYDWCVQNNYNIKVLVNNAAFGLSGLFENYSLQENTNLLQLNVVSYTQLCHLFIPMLKENPPSYILNICSLSAYQAVPLLTMYSSSKAYVRRFTRALRHELTGSGVSVTCVSPGPTDTEWVTRANVRERGLRIADRLNMTADEVASIAVKAMLAKKAEVITGFVNKFAAFLSWLLPNSFVERNASKFYK